MLPEPSSHLLLETQSPLVESRVEEALSAKVDEAMREKVVLARSLIGVVVELTVTPFHVAGVQAKAPPSSTPSHNPAPPVIEVQKSLQALPVTESKVRSPVMSRLVEVALVDEARVVTNELGKIT